jgi:hypothetical protein
VRDEYPREAERLELLASLRGEVLVFQKMDVRQLSVDGALIETAFPLHLGSLHQFRLTLDEGPALVSGRVVHSHIADVGQDVVVYQSGIEFVELPPPVLRAISAFIERCKRSQRS